MASLNLMKLKQNELKPLLRHNDREIRLKTNHSNMDINKDLTMNTTENIMDILQEACGESSTVCTDNGPSVSDNSMYVISNHVKFYGATALIFAKECFKALAEKMDSNLYILPSSQHELIAISEEIADPQSLKEMVCDINNSNVDEKDRLSYCVYKFCRKTETIEVAA